MRGSVHATRLWQSRRCSSFRVGPQIRARRHRNRSERIPENGQVRSPAVSTFRESLRGNAADRDLYARVKIDLARKEWKYGQNYADAKTPVIDEIMTRAAAVDPTEG